MFFVFLLLAFLQQYQELALILLPIRSRISLQSRLLQPPLLSSDVLVSLL